MSTPEEVGRWIRRQRRAHGSKSGAIVVSDDLHRKLCAYTRLMGDVLGCDLSPDPLRFHGTPVVPTSEVLVTDEQVLA